MDVNQSVREQIVNDWEHKGYEDGRSRRRYAVPLLEPKQRLFYLQLELKETEVLAAYARGYDRGRKGSHVRELDHPNTYV